MTSLLHHNVAKGVDLATISRRLPHLHQLQQTQGLLLLISVILVAFPGRSLNRPVCVMARSPVDRIPPAAAAAAPKAASGSFFLRRAPFARTVQTLAQASALGR